MITILLVDDEPLLRLGFRLVLDSQPDLKVVGEAADGTGAVARTAELDPDVVLMDVRMPGVDGIAATREIVRTHPRSRVLISAGSSTPTPSARNVVTRFSSLRSSG